MEAGGGVTGGGEEGRRGREGGVCIGLGAQASWRLPISVGRKGLGQEELYARTPGETREEKGASTEGLLRQRVTTE